MKLKHIFSFSYLSLKYGELVLLVFDINFRLFKLFKFFGKLSKTKLLPCIEKLETLVKSSFKVILDLSLIPFCI